MGEVVSLRLDTLADTGLTSINTQLRWSLYQTYLSTTCCKTIQFQ